MADPKVLPELCENDARCRRCSFGAHCASFTLWESSANQERMAAERVARRRGQWVPQAETREITPEAAELFAPIPRPAPDVED